MASFALPPFSSPSHSLTKTKFLLWNSFPHSTHQWQPPKHTISPLICLLTVPKLWLMDRKRKCIENGFNCHSKPLLDGFSSPSICPSRRLELSAPSHSCQKEICRKGLYFTQAKIQTHNHPIVNSMHNQSSISCFMIISIHLGLYYHSSWSNILLKIINE